MTKQPLKPPEHSVWVYAHELAYKLACERLAAITGIKEQCQKSGAQYFPDSQNIRIPYLGRTYQVSLHDGEVTIAESAESVLLRDKILLLHYFTRAKGTPLTGKMITYKELQEGINYYPTFFKRAISPVINRFKDEPPGLVDAGKRLGGQPTDYGDAAVTIPAFPRVPLTFVLWRGDKEFTPDGNILFDSTIPDYLPTEDITILCEVIAWRLARS